MPKARKDEEAPLIATTLGKETSFAGTLRFKDSLRIKGTFEGEIDAMGRLYIDADAVVSARRIRATNVVVGGTVRGDIEAADRLEMLPSAKVYGNVRTAKLRIADGVVFEGTCEMIRDPGAFNPFAESAAAEPGTSAGSER
ncbi:MAG TPA: polymer-forming cytoskeletal protein [Spirochaetia bacterium]|nr:polymer-forming cytoskeletal protein [Spirochaetia bacterium]HRZ65573.1 polymer-forming cytoskeletal protein [Spirochaetia bacterium]